LLSTLSHFFFFLRESFFHSFFFSLSSL